MQRDFTTREIAGLLEGMRDVPCRSSYAQGCRCPLHGGLRPAQQRTRLVAVADDAGVTFADQCDGSMTCGCERCCDQRAILVRTPHSRDKRQPWHPLPVARAA